jgi:hypothetical protein
MAQYYTLDEAAKKLGISGDEFRKRIATQWKNIRRFPDGPTLRFQSREIDELARSLGRSSEADLQMADAPLPLAEKPASGISKKPDDAIFVPPSSSDDFIPLAEDHVISSTGKTDTSGSDSDVKLESTTGPVKGKTGHDDATEVLELADDVKKPKPTFEVKSDSPPRKAAPRAHQVTSEFDLNLEADSDDFDLSLTDDSDEVPVGTQTRKGPRAGDSGINLQDPADSGISLEKESSEFELQLEPDAPKSAPRSGPKSGPKSAPRSGPKSGPKSAKIQEDSDSEFELTLDEPSSENSPLATDDQKDIFETDFELPAIDDSGSEDRTNGSALDESDFDLSVEDESEEESASEVVAIEEDDDGDNLKTVDDEEDRPKAVHVVEAGPANWGVLPAAVMIPTVAVMFFVGIMGYELLRSMWGYSTGNPVSGPITRTVAGMFGSFTD